MALISRFIFYFGTVVSVLVNITKIVVILA